MMHLPAPVSPAAAAAIPISPSADDVQSHSSSSSSSFVSWCESQHGSLPTTHQRLLDTARQGKGTDAAVVPIPATSAPPATEVALQTSVDVLHQFYGTEKKYGRVARAKSPPKTAAQVVTDDEGDNINNDDSDSASYDNEDDDELGEGEDGDGNDSYSSSDESVPEVVEIPAAAGQEEDLSSIFDLSVEDMMMSEEEYEEGGEEEEEEDSAEDEEGRDEENVADYGPGPKAILRNKRATREVGITDNGPRITSGKDIEESRIANTNEEPPTKRVTRFDLPSPIDKSKKKGVSFSSVGSTDDTGKTKNRIELLESKSGRSNKESNKNGENGKKKKKRRSRYISSASSSKAVIQSFMTHTRASMAKTRRSLSKGNKSSNTGHRASRNSGSKPIVTKAKAKRDDNNTAAAAEPTDANVSDAVARAKQRIRQHRQKVRNQGVF